MRISDWSSYVCSSDLGLGTIGAKAAVGRLERALEAVARAVGVEGDDTRRRVAAIERPLRTAQHLDALDVEEGGRARTAAPDRDFVHRDRPRAFGCGRVRLRSDAADIDRKSTRLNSSH